MAVSIKTNRMLWGRAASRCSLPECRRELVIDALETDDPSLVGEAAHIVAEEPDGPRGDPAFPIERLNKYDNLILLCNIHHKQVDDQFKHFSVDRLRTLKGAHEKWVRECLSGFDKQRQEDDELWAAYVDEWAARAELGRWLEHTYSLLQVQPGMSAEFWRNLSSLQPWLLSRVWPSRYPQIRSALENFRRVANDLTNLFQQYAEQRGGGEFLQTRKIYQIEQWDEKLYHLLHKRFEYHVDLLQDLTYELTRAANYVCDKVREHLDRTFRLVEGVLLVRTGMDMRMMEYTYRPEYRTEERVQYPYPGLAAFRDVRGSRDVHRDVGKDPTSEESPELDPSEQGAK